MEVAKAAIVQGNRALTAKVDIKVLQVAGDEMGGQDI